MYRLRRLTYVCIVFSTVIFLLWFLPRALNPVKPTKEKQDADRHWVNTSPYWLDRQACRWLSLCGLLHVKADPPGRPTSLHSVGNTHAPRSLETESARPRLKYLDSVGRAQKKVNSRGHGQRTLKGIPDYVLEYAPLVHLYSEEFFWPSDIAEHLEYMTPYVDQAGINSTEPVTLNNLNGLYRGPGHLFLKSNVDVESRPDWLHSWANIPPISETDDDGNDAERGNGWEDESDLIDGVDAPNWPPIEDTTWYEVDQKHPLHVLSDPRRGPGHKPKNLLTPRRSRVFPSDYNPGSVGGLSSTSSPMNRGNKPNDAGYSRAPATLILVDKGYGIVDAFWFFFYSYNLGQTVLGIRFGNHVGDWEHTMVRFDNGVPRAVYFSEHEGGQAYAWQAVEKRTTPGAGEHNATAARGSHEEARRPVIYSAVGSHAMYAMPGDHPYVLPFGMLKDVTDRGPLWDPAKNFRSYWYDYTPDEGPSSPENVRRETDEETNGGPGDGEHKDNGLEPTSENPDAPTSWFHYDGRWGDELYGLDDERQYRLFGQYHYVSGPQGPKFKNLARPRMCSKWACKIIRSIAEGRLGSWHS